MGKPKVNIDHFYIEDILEMYQERDEKRIKKREKKKEDYKEPKIGGIHIEINI